MPDHAEAARSYRRRGWAVVPVHTVRDGRCSCGQRDCPSPGKHPRVPWAAFTREPPSAEQVDEWWRRWPDANLAVVTGAVSGVVVLDVDPRHGGDRALAEMELRFGALPPSPEVCTGGAGRHLWFRAPPAPVASRPLEPGLDVKGEGGLVIVPPSMHASGRRYRWAAGRDPDALPLAAAPAWLAVPPPGRGSPATGGGAPPPARTAAERDEFAALWSLAGVTIAPGDHQYRCPFHDDHRPSLHIDADGCRWYCFGCATGGGIARLRELVGVGGTPSPRARLTTVPGLPPPTGVTLAGEETVAVVGESHHQDALLALTGGRRHYGGVDVWTAAELVPDPTDPIDPEAIAVLVSGERVGWLPRPAAHRYRSLVEAALARDGEASCVARIRGGWDRGRDDIGRFGVVLLLPSIPE